MSKTTFSKPPWYELIDPLKNLRSTLVPGTKELSLVILGITKLCLLYLFGCDKVVIYLNILFIQNVMNCDCFNMILLELCVCIKKTHSQEFIPWRFRKSCFTHLLK